MQPILILISTSLVLIRHGCQKNLMVCSDFICESTAHAITLGLFLGAALAPGASDRSAEDASEPLRLFERKKESLMD